MGIRNSKNQSWCAKLSVESEDDELFSKFTMTFERLMTSFFRRHISLLFHFLADLYRFLSINTKNKDNFALGKASRVVDLS